MIYNICYAPLDTFCPPFLRDLVGIDTSTTCLKKNGISETMSIIINYIILYTIKGVRWKAAQEKLETPANIRLEKKVRGKIT
jgi:hypothetical protein